MRSFIEPKTAHYINCVPYKITNGENKGRRERVRLYAFVFVLKKLLREKALQGDFFLKGNVEILDTGYVIYGRGNRPFSISTSFLGVDILTPDVHEHCARCI